MIDGEDVKIEEFGSVLVAAVHESELPLVDALEPAVVDVLSA